jgi:hypothetical protein
MNLVSVIAHGERLGTNRQSGVMPGAAGNIAIIPTGTVRFAEAARQLGLTATTLGRRVAAVEDELGLTLLERRRSPDAQRGPVWETHKTAATPSSLSGKFTHRSRHASDHQTGHGGIVRAATIRPDSTDFCRGIFRRQPWG